MQIKGQLIPFVRLTKDTWTHVQTFEGAAVLPLILGANMKDLQGTAQLEETQEGGTTRVSLLLHEGLADGPWYALPVGTIMEVERKDKKIVAITRYKLAAISLSQDAPEGSIPL